MSGIGHLSTDNSTGTTADAVAAKTKEKIVADVFGTEGATVVDAVEVFGNIG
jgi:hypothetical protein